MVAAGVGCLLVEHPPAVRAAVEAAKAASTIRGLGMRHLTGRDLPDGSPGLRARVPVLGVGAPGPDPSAGICGAGVGVQTPAVGLPTRSLVAAVPRARARDRSAAFADDVV